MTFMTGKLHLAAALVAAALLAACDTVSEPTSPIGVYALANMNGNGIPATMFEGEGYSLQVIHGTLDVAADFSYVVAITTLEIVDSNESEYVDSLRGTWTLDEMNALEFSVTGEEAFTFPGSWQGRHVTILFVGETSSTSYVFQRAR